MKLQRCILYISCFSKQNTIMIATMLPVLSKVTYSPSWELMQLLIMGSSL